MQRLLIGAALVGLAATAQAEITEKYDSVAELIHSHGDYDADEGTFELYSDEPPAFRLSPQVFAADPADVIYYETWRSAIYGVYQAFAHTGYDDVMVTAVPVTFDSDSGELLSDRAVTLAMDREQALAALQAVVDVESLDDTREKSPIIGYQWSPVFLDVYYEDHSPGLDAFISELREFCDGSCE